MNPGNSTPDLRQTLIRCIAGHVLSCYVVNIIKRMSKSVCVYMCVCVPFPSPGDLPDPGIKLVSLAGSFTDKWILHNEPLGKPISVTTKGYILDEFKAILTILQCLSFLIAMLRIIATICIMGLLQA